jgi:hypothetical protein
MMKLSPNMQYHLDRFFVRECWRYSFRWAGTTRYHHSDWVSRDIAIYCAENCSANYHPGTLRIEYKHQPERVNERIPEVRL